MNRFDPDGKIQWIAELVNSSTPVDYLIAGVAQDDCGVIRFGNEFLVVSTDFLNAKPIAEQLGIGDEFDFGRLTVAANLSDLCGSGAHPTALLIGAMFPPETDVAVFERFMRGAHFEASRWNVPIIGGDSKVGQCRSLFAVAIGSTKDIKSLFLQSGARLGDDVWASGYLGSCNAAVVGISRGEMPDSWIDWAKDRILDPRIPIAKSAAVAKSRIGHGGTDISDGLSINLERMCLASGFGCRIYADQIPVEQPVCLVADAINCEPWHFALGCGGDFQFLVTTKPQHRGQMESFGFTRIGEVVQRPGIEVQTWDKRLFQIRGDGHRAARGTSFPDEIVSLIRSIQSQQGQK